MVDRSFIVKNSLNVANGLLFANNGKVGINTTSMAVSLQVAANDAVFLPRGNTGQRPTSNSGLIRYNTETQVFEACVNTTWVSLTGNQSNAAQFLAATAGYNITPDQYWAAGAYVALSDAASITWNMSLGINFNVTLTTSRTLAFPSNPKVGQSGFIEITQPGGGGATLSFASGFKFDSGTAPSIDTVANHKTVLGYHCRATDTVLISMPYYGTQ